MSATSKEVISFRALIQPGQVVKFHERIKGDATIEQVRVRFYIGQQKALHVRPYVVHRGNKPEDLITYPEGTDAFLSGDDDYLDFPCVVPVGNDDEAYVWVQNTDADNAYTLVVDMVIDYYGGKSRVV